MATIPHGHHPLLGSERAPVPGARRIGAADPAEEITVTLRLRRRPGAPALPDLDQLRERKIGSPPLVTREEFAERYGADPSDVELVRQFAQRYDLTVGEVSLARRTVALTGTAAQLSTAFAIELSRYESPQGAYRGREGALHLPANLHPAVEGVFGLDNRRQARPLSARLPDDASPVQGVNGVTPPQVAGLYGFPSESAAGQTIGLLEFGGGYRTSDINSFFNNVGKPAPTLVPVGIDGVTNSPGVDPDSDGEVALDIDVAGSVAVGAKIAVYFAPWTEQGWIDAVTTAVHDTTNRPSVLSISWGWAELQEVLGLTWTQQAIDAVSATFQEAAALGVTVFAASGDDGSNCQIGNHHAHTLYPGTDPYITSCGGTRISNVSGSTFTETTWSQSYGTTGGGVSDRFARPIWQAWAGTPGSVNDSHIGRTIPDVAGNADPASGYPIIVGGSSSQYGGTSAVAPLYAALTAILNADLHEPIGYINPNLYMFQGSPVYRDIADGASNSTEGAPGYTSGAGYDACTGLGSLNGNELLLALRGVGEQPALAQFGASLYMAWKGIERDDRVFFSHYDGTTWSPQQQVPNIGSSAGPALAAFQGKLFMAWKGILADQGIYWSTYDGTSWAAQQIDGSIGTSHGPSLAVYNGLLYMIWKGVEGDQRIFWRTFDGSHWTPQQFIPGVATSHGPSLAVYDNQLYAAWKGMWDDQGIYWSTFNGTSWSAQQHIAGVATSEGPSIVPVTVSPVFEPGLSAGEIHLPPPVHLGWSLLLASWKGMSGDEGIYWSTFDGTSWATQQLAPNRATSVGPGLGIYNGAAYAAWKGMLGDQTIWYSRFTGSGWTAQTQIPGVGTSPDLTIVEQRGPHPAERVHKAGTAKQRH